MQQLLLPDPPGAPDDAVAVGNNANATKSLGIPTAQLLLVERIKSSLVAKVEGKIEKLRVRHKALAARIVIANSLLIGCLWYMLMVWAGKVECLRKLQRIIEKFVWAGRSRVNRATTALPRSKGGLNLMGVEIQYQALIRNFMLWIMKEETHPLRSLLRLHIF